MKIFCKWNFAPSTPKFTYPKSKISQMVTFLILKSAIQQKEKPCGRGQGSQGRFAKNNFAIQLQQYMVLKISLEKARERPKCFSRMCKTSIFKFL